MVSSFRFAERLLPRAAGSHTGERFTPIKKMLCLIVVNPAAASGWPKCSGIIALAQT
jgi:phosphotransferase system  glucose/maltose/N-acetylglucosamine-specific IIC component